MRCALGSLLGIPPNFLFAQQIEIIMIADLIVCRGGIWYFGKHKALKPKRGAFSPEFLYILRWEMAQLI